MEKSSSYIYIYVYICTIYNYDGDSNQSEFAIFNLLNVLLFVANLLTGVTHGAALPGKVSPVCVVGGGYLQPSCTFHTMLSVINKPYMIMDIC